MGIDAAIDLSARHIEAAKHLAEGGYFAHATFFLMVAAEEQAKAEYAIAAIGGDPVVDPTVKSQEIQLPLNVRFGHEPKVVLGLVFSIAERAALYPSKTTPGKGSLPDSVIESLAMVATLFDDPEGLREAALHSGRRPRGRINIGPPGELHYRAILPWLENRPDSLRRSYTHPPTREASQQYLSIVDILMKSIKRRKPRESADAGRNEATAGGKA